jgi:predicted aspartyl protease
VFSISFSAYRRFQQRHYTRKHEPMFKKPVTLPRQILAAAVIMRSMKACRICLIKALRGRRLAHGLLVFGIVSSALAVALGQGTGRPGTHQSSTNVRFENGRNSVTIPFEGENLIILPVRVNNSAPMRFLFDTGAGISVLTARTAAKLKLKKADDVDVKGVGGTVQGFLAKGISLSITGLTVRNQAVAVLPIDFPCEFSDIAGIIGYEFIKEFVVEIDYEAKTMSFSNPQTYQYTGHGDLLPIELTGNTPRIRARIDLAGAPPQEGIFEIDTGSDGALSVNSPFIQKHSLLSLLGTKVDSVHRGAGGESKSVDARIRRLEIGRYVIAEPLVTFREDKEGSQPATDNDGPIGNEILRRFKIVFDYSRRRAMFEPNAHLSDPIDAGMSGIEFDPEDCGLSKIVKVEENSAADKAGIKAGDVIVAINGRPVGEFNSMQIEKLLAQHGAEHSLTLNRGGKTVVVKIKLSRLM